MDTSCFQSNHQTLGIDKVYFLETACDMHQTWTWHNLSVFYKNTRRWSAQFRALSCVYTLCIQLSPRIGLFIDVYSVENSSVFKISMKGPIFYSKNWDDIQLFGLPKIWGPIVKILEADGFSKLLLQKTDFRCWFMTINIIESL